MGNFNVCPVCSGQLIDVTRNKKERYICECCDKMFEPITILKEVEQWNI
jgi:ribosomal protein L37AE/L43A